MSRVRSFNEYTYPSTAIANDGKFLGVVLMLLDLKGMRSIFSDETGLGESGELFAVAEADNKLQLLLPRKTSDKRSISRTDAPRLFAAVVEGTTSYNSMRLSGTKLEFM